MSWRPRQLYLPILLLKCLLNILKIKPFEQSSKYINLLQLGRHRHTEEDRGRHRRGMARLGAWLEGWAPGRLGTAAEQRTATRRLGTEGRTAGAAGQWAVGTAADRGRRQRVAGRAEGWAQRAAAEGSVSPRWLGGRRKAGHSGRRLCS